MARITLGSVTSLDTPSTASTANHTIITGPNSTPMAAVPRLWMENRPSRMTAAMDCIQLSTAGAASFTPSTADSTEMAGVIMPSP